MHNDQEREKAIQQARERFGKKFAHEYGSTWKPRETPFLTAWLAQQVKTKETTQ